MITSVNNTKKNGKPWGKFVMEDYNGSHEFALFSKDYETFQTIPLPDYFLLLRGKVQDIHSAREMELKTYISMVQSQRGRDTMIKEITITLGCPRYQITHLPDHPRGDQEQQRNNVLKVRLC